MTKVPHNSAPALSQDLGTLYVAVSNGTVGYLVALNSTTLAPVARVRLKDPKSGLGCAVERQRIGITDRGDGRRCLLRRAGESIRAESRPRLAAAFRWQSLAIENAGLVRLGRYGEPGSGADGSLLPGRICVPSDGEVQQLRQRGDGQHKLAVLDPNATQTDPVTRATVMKEVLTILGPTPDPRAVASGSGASIPRLWTR